MPLVLSRVASASFSLKAISRDCAVVADARHLAGVTQEPEEAIEAWEQVQRSSPTLLLASVGIGCACLQAA